MSTKWALKQSNLAMIGALDDFYDTYCTISHIYSKHLEQFQNENGKQPEPWTLDTLARKEVRTTCEPLINKYLYLFTGDRDHIFATAYGFHVFSFFDVDMGKDGVKVKEISFSEFLENIQYVVTLILWKWIRKSEPEYALERLHNRINARIENCVSAKLQNGQIHPMTAKAPTDAILYLFDTLSSTSCYKKNHPVVASRFVADKVDGSGQIILPVHYCNYCRKYFIGIKTLNLFEKNFGKLIIQKRVLTGKENDFSDFRSESLLHQLGYNVIDGNMTEQERQNLLIYLLNHRKISYLEICATIEQNIRMFQYSYRHQLAVTKWKDDLRYIGEYVVREIESNPQEK